MKITPCSPRPILNECGLENFDYQIDCYTGCEHYCYYCYVLDQAETDWAREILIHDDMVNRLRKELSGIPPQTIYMGWQTDPYQPCEAECRQTRQALELLLEKGFSASILTKSDLVLRDMDVLREMNDPAVSVSVAFNDDDVRKRFESKTMDTGLRIDALRKLRSEGVRTSALICPVIPYITDVEPLIDMLAPHTDKIWIYGLSIQNESARGWRNVKNILKRRFPDLEERVEAVLFSKNHPYWQQLRQTLVELKNERQLNLSIHV